MTWQYDRDADALYVAFSDAQVSRTIEADPLTMVDLDRHGTVVGVEVIHPAREWPLRELADCGVGPGEIKHLRLLSRAADNRFNYEPPRPTVAV